jgi:hypothetical protein
MCKRRVIGVQNLGHTRKLSRCRCRCASIAASYQHMHVRPALKRSGNRVEGGTLEGGVVVFGDDEDGH